MSKIHVLHADGKQLTLVCHIPAPTANAGVNFAKPNAVGWDRCLILARKTSSSVLLPGLGGTADPGTIDSDEMYQLMSGDLVEKVVTYDLRDDWETLTTGQKATRLQEKYDSMLADVQAEWQRVHRITGSVLT